MARIYTKAMWIHHYNYDGVHVIKQPCDASDEYLKAINSVNVVCTVTLVSPSPSYLAVQFKHTVLSQNIGVIFPDGIVFNEILKARRFLNLKGMEPPSPSGRPRIDSSTE